MTNLLKQAFAAAANLSDVQQDELAEILLSLVGADGPEDGEAPPPVGEPPEGQGARVTKH